jgi:hypothetical protein
MTSIARFQEAAELAVWLGPGASCERNVEGRKQATPRSAGRKVATSPANVAVLSGAILAAIYRSQPFVNMVEQAAKRPARQLGREHEKQIAKAEAWQF